MAGEERTRQGERGRRQPCSHPKRCPAAGGARREGNRPPLARTVMRIFLSGWDSREARALSGAEAGPVPPESGYILILPVGHTGKDRAALTPRLEEAAGDNPRNKGCVFPVHTRAAKKREPETGCSTGQARQCVFLVRYMAPPLVPPHSLKQIWDQTRLYVSNGQASGWHQWPF